MPLSLSLSIYLEFREQANERNTRHLSQSKTIRNQVHWFNLEVDTIVNGLKVTGPLHFTAMDTVQTYYKWGKVAKADKLDVLVEYAHLLRGSKLYTEFED